MGPGLILMVLIRGPLRRSGVGGGAVSINFARTGLKGLRTEICPDPIINFTNK
jgi:hypothetical protein